MKIGIACSGGADSTALLVLLAQAQAQLGFEAIVLHVDHGLRKESAADAEYVRSLAARFGLRFYSTRVKVQQCKGESLEMAARRYRLKFFAQKMRTLHLDAIATGHHLDDVAETFIMRMARGSGADGLAGLKRVSEVDGIRFIRPLLDLHDSELRAFLTAHNITWREDSTNNDTTILRNKVRHIILPFLRKNLDEHISEHLAKSAAILRGDLTLPAEPLINKVQSQQWDLIVAPAVGWTTNLFEASFSPEALRGRTLEVRTWRDGDRITPTGLNGHSRKLQDVFVTAKISPSERRALPLIVDAQTNEVLWVPGYRTALAVAVSNMQAPSIRFTLVRKN